MKKIILNTLLILLMFGTFSTLSYATESGGSEQLLEESASTDITIEEGNNVTLQSGVTSDAEVNGEVNVQTNTSQPSNGSQNTDAALSEIRDLRRGALGILNSWRSSTRNTRRLSGSQLVQAIQNGNSLIVVGNQTFDIDSYNDGILGPASMLYTIVRYNSDNNPDNDISNIAVTTAQNGSGNASRTGVRYPEWNNLSLELQNEAIRSIMGEEGLTLTEEQFIEVYYPENQNIGRLGIHHGMLDFNLSGFNPNFRRLGLTGFRADLVRGGLRDTPYWYNRYKAYTPTPNSSVAAEDYINITYLQEYRISNVVTSDVTEIDYDNCERLWVVENLTTGDIQEFVRHTEDLTFTISGLAVGDYRVTPAIKTNITTGSTVSYKIYEYMFETSTHNLLWYNESSTKTIYLGGATRALGYVPTGEIFNIHVNSLGEIEQESNYIQRID